VLPVALGSLLALAGCAWYAVRRQSKAAKHERRSHATEAIMPPTTGQMSLNAPTAFFQYHSSPEAATPPRNVNPLDAAFAPDRYRDPLTGSLGVHVTPPQPASPAAKAFTESVSFSNQLYEHTPVSARAHLRSS